MKALALALASLAAAAAARAADPPPLVLESKIALGKVSGRIDHLAVDAERRRLFVAELGNDTVDVVDLTAGAAVRRLTRLREPQGIGYSARDDMVAVASAGDGTVQLFRGAELAPAGVVALDDDADNVRVDPGSGQFVVGYGKGGLAVVDPSRAAVVGRAALHGHPEG